MAKLPPPPSVSAHSAWVLANIRKAMTPDGRVLLYEAIVGTRNAPSLAKFLDLEMLVVAGGRERNAA